MNWPNSTPRTPARTRAATWAGSCRARLFPSSRRWPFRWLRAPRFGETVFQLRVGDLSAPIRTDRGYVVLSVKEIQPAHPGTLAVVRDKVTSDIRREKSVELAKSRAEELYKRGQSGEGLAAAAKALGVELKTSEPFPRTGTV